MGYKKSIDSHVLSIKNINSSHIKRYPESINFFSYVDEQLNKFNDDAQSVLDTYDQHKLKYNEKKENVQSKYNKNIILNKENFLNSLKEISQKKIKEINDYKQTLDENISLLSKRIIDNKTLLVNDNKKINNAVYSFLLKRDQNIAKREQELLNSKKTYESIIQFFNEDARLKTNLIHSTNSKILLRSEEEYKKLVFDLNNEINIKLNNINKLEEELNQRLERVHNDILKQSTNLNNKISLVNDKMQYEINQHNIHKSLEINQINTDIEIIKSKASHKNKNILKEFVDTLTKIDKEYDVNYGKYLKTKNNLNKNYNKQISDIEKNIKNINKSEINYKEKNALLKQQMDKINSIKKLHFKELNHLDHSLAKYKDSVKSRKYTAEISKNFEIKKLQREEKHLISKKQDEITKINYQIDLLIKNLKIQYDIKINDFKYQANLKTASLQKDLEKLQTIIKSRIFVINSNYINLQNEKKYHQALHDLIHSTNTNATNKKISSIKIIALLNIENNKILQEYNKTQFNNAVLRENEIFNHNEKTAFLKRDFFKEKIQLESDFTLTECNYLRNIAFRDINYQQIEESNQKNISKAVYLKNLGYHKYKLYTDRLRLEKINIINCYKTFYSQIINITEQQNLILFALEEEYRSGRLTISFCNDYYSFITAELRQLKLELINYFYNQQIQTVNERIELERGFISNTFNIALEEKKQISIEKIILREKALEQTLSNYRETLNNYIKNKINYENELLILKKDYRNGNSIYNKENYYKQTKEISIVINDLDNKIDKNEQLIAMIEKDLNKIPKYIVTSEQQFKKRNNRIIKKLEKGSQEYSNIITALNKTHEVFIKMEANYQVFEKVVFKNGHSLKLYSRYNENMTNFMKDILRKIKNKHDAYLKQYLINERKEIQRININNQKEKKNLVKEKLKEKREFSQLLNAYNLSVERLENDFHKNVELHNTEFSRIQSDLSNNSLAHRDKLSSDVFAMYSNINQVKNEKNDYLKDLNASNLRSSRLLLKLFLEQKNETKEELALNNKKYNSLLKQTNMTYKDKSKDLHDENKESKKYNHTTIKYNKKTEKRFLRRLDISEFIKEKEYAKDIVKIDNLCKKEISRVNKLLK